MIFVQPYFTLAVQTCKRGEFIEQNSLRTPFAANSVRYPNQIHVAVVGLVWFLRRYSKIAPNTTNAITTAPPTIHNTLTGLTRSKPCPITQGRVMLPRLAPTKNQPVTAPVITMCLPANVRIVGKAE